MYACTSSRGMSSPSAYLFPILDWAAAPYLDQRQGDTISRPRHRSLVLLASVVHETEIELGFSVALVRRLPTHFKASARSYCTPWLSYTSLRDRIGRGQLLDWPGTGRRDAVAKSPLSRAATASSTALRPRALRALNVQKKAQRVCVTFIVHSFQADKENFNS